MRMLSSFGKGINDIKTSGGCTRLRNQIRWLKAESKKTGKHVPTTFQKSRKMTEKGNQLSRTTKSDILRETDLRETETLSASS